jgi:hypothetical protein
MTGKGEIFRNSGFYFVALLILAITAFWQPYFSFVLGDYSDRATDISLYKHLHVGMSVLWLTLLIAQPFLIRYERRQLHRKLGRTSYVLAPLVFLSIIFLAHSQIVTLAEQSDSRRHFILFIQIGFALFFAVLYGMAIFKRRTMPIHARYMICTGILMIEPILVRVFKFNLSFISWSVPYQYVTWPMVDLLLLALVIRDRRGKTGGRVFQHALVVFVVFQFLHLTITDTRPWISFAGWFAALPLT